MPDLSKTRTLLAVLAAVWTAVACISNWVTSVNAYDDRIATVERHANSNTDAIAKSDRVLSRLDYNIQIIARKVGVVPLEPAKP
jgi:hypothetical protein